MPVRRLAAHPDLHVRHRTAQRSDLTPELVALLAADPDPDVRRAATANPRTPVGIVTALLADPDAADELREGAAASPHLTQRQLMELLDRLDIPR
ncbi:hypothetical protein [Kitasatospora sp. NPDC059673]|uniref:hypothetical protein n=1 Tax=Kitasatospora sp. NPDC059673 TaxID=3346901 RepID=UPI0036CD8C35